MNVQRIRGWLLQLPKPHRVRVSGDGEPQMLTPGRSFAKLADTIAALAPELVECLDKDGQVLRATKLDGEEARRSDAAAVPEALKMDANAAMLTHFANLVHRAYEHSCEIAFSKMVELVEKMNDRSDSIEQRLERAEALNRRLQQDAMDAEIELAQQAMQSDGDMGQQIMSGFMTGAMNGKAQQAKPAANGKG